MGTVAVSTDLVPAAAEHVITVPVGDEAIVVDDATGQMHLLNPTGALVWQLLDGGTSVDELCTDLAEAFGAPRSTVVADVAALVQALLDSRFLVAPGYELPVADLVSCSCGDTHPPEDIPLERITGNPCLHAEFPLGLAGEMAVAVMGVPVVLRANELPAVARLADRCAPWLVDHPGTEPAISLAVGASEGRRRGAHIVHREGILVRATHSLDTALDTVVALARTFAPAPDDAVPLHVRPLERDGSVVLVSDGFRDVLDGHHRRITAAGFRDGGYQPVLVDPGRAEALLPVGPLDRLEWRRVPIESVVVFAPPEDRTSSPAARIAHLVALAAGRTHHATGAGIQAVIDLDDRVPIRRLSSVDLAALLGALDRSRG